MRTRKQIVPGQSTPFSAALAPSSRHRWWAVPLAVVGLAPMVAVAVSSFVPSTALIEKRNCVEVDAAGTCTRRGPAQAVEFAVVPADASPAGSRLTVKGLKEYDSNADILFVTVREPELRLFEWFLAKGNPGLSGLFSYSDLYRSVTPAQDRANAFRDMRDAKRDAYYVGLKTLGYDVQLVDEGPAIVQGVTCFARDAAGACSKPSPAAGVLEPNDQITSIDGKPVNALGDLGPLVSTHQPGDTITVGYKHDGEQRQGSVTLAAAPDDGRPLIGIQMADTRVVHLPDNVSIDFDTADIGGPSAGLSFTLTLIDRLSPGDLTGGKKVAVTGTIDVDGNVGPIGGLQSKASAVRQAGAHYFIVPFAQGAADIAAAQKAAGSGMTIIPVKTLDEALAALHSIGGDPFVKPVEASSATSTTTA
ncbi:MAG: PDZ domain-containing protein [Ilumatobacteraceae bacterium]